MSIDWKGFGWSASREAAFAEWAARGFEPARIVRVERGIHRLVGRHGERDGVLSGQLRHHTDGAADLPTIGDWVAVEGRFDGPSIIEAVVDRRSRLSRRGAGRRGEEQVVAANVDVVFVVMGLDRDFNLRRLERFLVMVRDCGARPVVVLNKLDLCQAPEERRSEVVAVAGDADVVTVSASAGLVEEIEEHLVPGETVALVGSSGVGKSTLVNALAGERMLATGVVRSSDGRGRHTTTARHLFRLASGALLIDNPGIREVQPWHAEEGLDETFADIGELAESCRFRDCRHEGEPGCAVAEALARGDLDLTRLESHRAMEKEARALAQRLDVRAARAAGRKQGRLYRAVQSAKSRRNEEG